MPYVLMVSSSSWRANNRDEQRQDDPSKTEFSIKSTITFFLKANDKVIIFVHMFRKQQAFSENLYSSQKTSE